MVCDGLSYSHTAEVVAWNACAIARRVAVGNNDADGHVCKRANFNKAHRTDPTDLTKNEKYK